LLFFSWSSYSVVGLFTVTEGDWLVEEAARIAAGERDKQEKASQERHDIETAQIRQQLAKPKPLLTPLRKMRTNSKD